MAVIVYQYGTRAASTSACRYELPPEAVEQIRLAHELRNTLVALIRDHEQAMRTLWSQYPTVAEAESRLAEAEDRVGKLTEQARREHAADRTTATRTATAVELRAAKADTKAARAARRTAIGEAYLLAKPEIEQTRADYKARVKATYAIYVQQRGLYWATYNQVVDGHRTSIKLVDAARKQGKAAEYRFHRWTGEGTISVQLQRSATQPVRTPALLASGEGPWRNVFQCQPWVPEREWATKSGGERRRTARTGLVVLSIGGGRTIQVPVVVHRMLPADTDIVAAQLTRRRVAGTWSIQVTVTARIPDPTPVTSGPAIALHLGWRSRPDGSTRVATWASTQPLTVPHALADLIRVYDDGRWGEIVVRPTTTGLTRWAGAADHPSALRSVRDIQFEPIRDKVAAWLDEHPQPDPRPDDPDRQMTGHRVRAWRAQGRLANLALRWRDTPPDGPNPPVDLLEAWRRQDRHLWEGEAHERAQVTAGRDYTWRQIGAWLADQAGLLIVDDTDLRTLRQKEDATEDDPVLPGSVAAAARARAALLAPGRLRQLVTSAATRRGVAVQTVKAAGLTRKHAACGHVGAPDARYATAAVVVCPACGTAYDQDWNATVLMLAGGSEPSASPT